MSKPILFTTISRDKYEKLSKEDKAKKNYIIKNIDGSNSKAIGNLEGVSESGGGGESLKAFPLHAVDWSEDNYHLVTENSVDEIMDYYNTNGLDFYFIWNGESITTTEGMYMKLYCPCKFYPRGTMELSIGEIQGKALLGDGSYITDSTVYSEGWSGFNLTKEMVESDYFTVSGALVDSLRSCGYTEV